MRIRWRRNWSVALACGLTLVLVGTVFASRVSVQKKMGDLWLTHHVGDQVIVSFIKAPPDMGQSVKAKLMDAETPGIVLQFGREEIFFAFSNIISVERAPR